MQTYKILWADDEIDLLKPHIMFLDKKGYDVVPVNSGSDAVDLFENEHFDVVFLDENMPGMTGLETLNVIKSKNPNIPVVMITKSEEEQIMEEAIGAKIADYLIKPLNPNQILLSVKKILDNKRLVSERANISYQQDFRSISMSFSEALDHSDWVDIYNKLIRWELEFDQTSDRSMAEVLEDQKQEANASFARFIKNNYANWLKEGVENKPILSHELFNKKILPVLAQESPVHLIVIDNLRFDQWKVIEPLITEYYNLEEEDSYYSLLPTTTAYSRNAIFSGLTPDDMEYYHSDIWVGEDSDNGKNNNEEEFLRRQLESLELDLKISYSKIKNIFEGKALVDNIENLVNNHLNVIVYNFVDMLSHARTDMAMIKELAPDESAYRSLTRSWFAHSPLLDAIRKLSQIPGRLIITTDHGTIRVKRPFKIVGDRNTNTNLRYKQGKNLGYESDDIFTASKPENLHLPKLNVSTSYVFAIKDYFFAYPNNYNYYVNFYRDTFQHGGISMEEMIIPFIHLSRKA